MAELFVVEEPPGRIRLCLICETELGIIGLARLPFFERVALNSCL